MRMDIRYLLAFLILTSCRSCFAEEYKILINIPSRTLELIKNGSTINTYSVGIGQPNFPTPIGNFKVVSKIKNPGWENPYKPAGESRVKAGKGNPLGTRWIGFHNDKRGEYGMHGTNRPSSVGKYSSHGCVRMLVKNSEKLFDKVEIGTPVKVSYYVYKLKIKNNKIIVQKYPNAYKRKINARKSIEEQLNSINEKYILDENKVAKAINMQNGGVQTIGEILKIKDEPPDN